MEPQQPRGNFGWAAIVGGVLLGTIKIKMLWQSQPGEPFPFTQLPKEMQNQIIYFLSLNTTASSLKEAAFTINSLAQVNHELNKLINGPAMCLELIKHLAKKFNCSDEQAAKALQTKEAKRRAELQNKLYIRCITEVWKINTLKNIPSLESLIGQGVDLEFTYNTPTSKVFATPLTIAISAKNGMLKTLCSLGNKYFDINQYTPSGTTALIFAISLKAAGKTEILLNAGADPNLADFTGLTPLAAAQQTDNQEIINLIQDAIVKKHALNKGINQ